MKVPIVETQDYNEFQEDFKLKQMLFSGRIMVE
jgi:hypothetical protein